jgi:hypothetical protein
MKIAGIIKVFDEVLYSIHFEGDENHAWKQFYTDWGNPQYVSDFLHEHQQDLRRSPWKQEQIEDLVTKTVRNVRFMLSEIYNAASQHRSGKDVLDHYFAPLDNRDRPLQPFQLVKHKGEYAPRWLRLYGIRVNENLFFITGSAIKLTLNMEDHELTRNELRKMQFAKDYLRKHLDDDHTLQEGYL